MTPEDLDILQTDCLSLFGFVPFNCANIPLSFLGRISSLYQSDFEKGTTGRVFLFSFWHMALYMLAERKS